MKRARNARRRRSSEAITLEELERWIEHLDPPPRVDGGLHAECTDDGTVLAGPWGIIAWNLLTVP